MEIGPLFPLFRRWWWTLIIAAWSAGIVGYVIASRTPPTYAASTTLLVGPLNTDNETLRASSQLVNTYTDLATSSSVLTAVADTTGIPLHAGTSSQAVRAEGDDTTRLLTVHVELPDPGEATRVAQGVADHLVGLSVAGGTRPEGELQIIDPPAAGQIPVAPNTSLLVLFSAAAGALAAALAALLIEALSPAIRSDREASRAADAPIIGMIDDAGITRGRRRPEPSGLPPMHPGYGLIAARLLADDEVGSVLVASSAPREGTGELALDLARAVAATGRDVTIVPADPTGDPVASIALAESADAAAARGRPAASAIGNQRSTRATRPEGVPIAGAPGVHLWIAPTADLLGRRSAASLREEIGRAGADGRFVIVDGGAADGSTPALGWARAADATVLLVRRGRTEREALAVSAETLRSAGAQRLNLVVLGFPARRRHVRLTAVERPPASSEAAAARPGSEQRADDEAAASASTQGTTAQAASSRKTPRIDHPVVIVAGQAHSAPRPADAE